MFILEIPNEEVIDHRVNLFFNRIDNIMSKENHIYKYPGTRKVLEMLNEICVELEISVRFFQERNSIGFQCRKIEIEIFFFEEIENRFRRVYRCQ